MKLQNSISESFKYGQKFDIGENNIIGLKRKRLNVKYAIDLAEEARRTEKVIFGDRCVVANNSIIYEGVTFGDDCFIDDFVRVGAFSKIGSGTILLFGVKIYEEAIIGENCRIAGFLPNGVTIGNNVTMMGTITHKYRRPLNWSRTELSPTIEDDVVVGLGAVIVGGVKIGKNAYIAANSTVTKDVPQNSIVLNTNEIMTIEEFEKRKLEKTEWYKRPKEL